MDEGCEVKPCRAAGAGSRVGGRLHSGGFLCLAEGVGVSWRPVEEAGAGSTLGSAEGTVGLLIAPPGGAAGHGCSLGDAVGVLSRAGGLQLRRLLCPAPGGGGGWRLGEEAWVSCTSLCTVGAVNTASALPGRTLQRQWAHEGRAGLESVSIVRDRLKVRVSL